MGTRTERRDKNICLRSFSGVTCIILLRPVDASATACGVRVTFFFP